RRSAMRRPAGMGDPGGPVQRIGLQLAREIVEFALGPPAVEPSVVDRADAGGVIAAIFESLEPVEQALHNTAIAEDSDKAADHTLPLCGLYAHGIACPSRISPFAQPA